MLMFDKHSARATACTFLLVSVFLTGCNDSGTTASSSMDASTALAPTVTSVAPADKTTGVPINDSVISVDFSDAMAPITGGAAFTLACAAPCVNPAGTVALNASGSVATFSLNAGVKLAALTVYTATVSGATSMVTGLALQSPFTWQFTTGATLDSTRPRVILTVPATAVSGATDGVPNNTAITAAFSEDMAPATITAANFTITCGAPCVPPTGDVTYEVGSRTALFMPSAALAVGTTYTAKVSSVITDLAGNGLAGGTAAAAGDYIWAFTTASAIAAVSITVASTNPAAGQMSQCADAPINVTFHVPVGVRMDPNSVNATTFNVVGPGSATAAVIAASVVLDAATGTVATLTPQSALSAGDSYKATVVGGVAGVRDLAIPADDLSNSFTWDFIAGPATGGCLTPINLGSAALSGTFGGSAGMTSSGTLTVINGNIGTTATGTSSITGLHDTAGDVYTQTTANVGTVNGTIYTCTHSTTGPTSAAPNAANCSTATQAREDAQAAYLALTALPPGADPGANLAGLTLAPGVYTAPAGSFLIQGGDLTLDAAGNADAVWVFQMATTLTVGGPGAAAPESIILAGGAQAKNVFWQVGTAATINAGGGGTMVGTIISQAGAAFSTAGNTAVVTLNGRVLSLNASVTLVDTVINVPAP